MLYDLKLLLDKYSHLIGGYMDDDVVEQMEYDIHMACVEYLKHVSYGEGVEIRIDIVKELLAIEEIRAEIPEKDYKELKLYLQEAIPDDYEEYRDMQNSWDADRRESMKELMK